MVDSRKLSVREKVEAVAWYWVALGSAADYEEAHTKVMHFTVESLERQYAQQVTWAKECAEHQIDPEVYEKVAKLKGEIAVLELQEANIRQAYCRQACILEHHFGDAWNREYRRRQDLLANSAEPKDHTGAPCPCGDPDCSRPFGHQLDRAPF